MLFACESMACNGWEKTNIRRVSQGKSDLTALADLRRSFSVFLSQSAAISVKAQQMLLSTSVTPSINTAHS